MYAEAGAGVACTDLKASDAEATAADCRKFGLKAAGLKLDVTNESERVADLGPRNIRVNAIAPGAICTAALATVLTPDVERTMLKHTPLARLGEGPDITAAEKEPPPRSESALPNILLITSDDVGMWNVGAYSHGMMVPTPNLDRIAREGMLFTDHDAQPT
jgi:NAD(P)-dependent dehydrogenase (short-subunit alcohol dehydrogenase family)